MEGRIYVVLPDGTILWPESPDDYEIVREEMADLQPDEEDG